MRAFVSPGWWAFLASAALFVGCVVYLHWLTAPVDLGASGDPIVVYCADALRVPMEAIQKSFEKEIGQSVELRIGSSESILTQLRTSKSGDLFLPADDSYLDKARKLDLIRETLPLASMSAVVISNPAAPKPVKTWADFTGPDVELVLANDATAIGKLTHDALAKSARWSEIERRKPTFQGKVSEVGAAVRINPKAAGIVWDAVAVQFPQLTAIELPELASVRSNVTVAVTAFTKQPAHALRFARYVAANDKGLPELSSRHYRIAERADVYAEHPELRLFGGSMLRPALEETIREFQEREGITIHTSWNGCGILVTEINGGKLPDLYFACEPRFLQKVQSHFEEPEIVSSNRLVVAVRKGNPHAIRDLKDLGKEGLKLGVGHENQCAMGDLTKMTFLRTGLYGRINRNVVKHAPSGDSLIGDFRSGALDVIVCYESNVMPFLNEFEYFPIDIGDSNTDCTNPLQPVAIAKATRYPQLARRLMDAFQSPTSRARFEKLGFGWKIATK